ncbi:toll/interleukin-1 receptor domain-containing protein [Microtetraspora sp. AC03309]|uniref:toll/interleukin-1 receptor domain-containing protein n=1 Tax=Microtetraspora sp. AC03309 TaxID=2779376 RepID=UPI001E393350|nr:toll/interleukin-1 receptor domain-containing protein [Microtetraspora sp. AC03309]MCC5581865.1 toll/interleukin-1 receptor domain-containing protein [Microtetraspora sp. AC03309]
MPIFISYSHQDGNFVDRLAQQLVQNKVRIWMDKWELHVGDSLISKIQDAITDASALLVILSQSSVTSAWCQRELNGGLMRELDERQVIVLPVLIEDCMIPIFLRDKLYADFRHNFDDGLNAVLEAVARISNAAMGRIDEADYHIDWALDWQVFEDDAEFRLTLVEQALGQPYTVLTLAEIAVDQEATLAYLETERQRGTEEAQKEIVSALVAATNKLGGTTFILKDQFEISERFQIIHNGLHYYIGISARRLGVDTGRDLLVRVGEQFQNILTQMENVTNGPTK